MNDHDDDPRPIDVEETLAAQRPTPAPDYKQEQLTGLLRRASRRPSRATRRAAAATCATLGVLLLTIALLSVLGEGPLAAAV